jgi:uncharacterized protein
LIGHYFKELFAGTWKEADLRSREAIAAEKQFSPDLKAIIILVYAAAGLMVVRYFGNTTAYLGSVTVNPNRFDMWYCGFFFGSELGKFHSILFWIGSILVIYLLIPALIVKLVFREKLRDYGFRVKGIAKDYPLYIAMLAVMLPLVYIASTTKSFQARYPLFQPSRENLFPLLLWWELAYFLQFVAVEFFFRGFMIHGTKLRFGFYSVFIMTIPYCMVHFGKPFGETMAAIVAGIVLGTLSLKSRSIILGILIHYSIAITMDGFALWREGIFSITN